MDNADTTGTTEAKRGSHRSSLVARVATGAVVAVLGVLTSKLLLDVSGEISFVPLVGAVAVAVWVAGGVGGGAALFTAWTIAAIWIPDPRVTLLETSIRWSASLAFGLVVAAVGLRLRRGRERATQAAERAERSHLRVESLQMLAAQLSAALTPEEVARVMIEGVPAAIGAHGGALGLLDGDELVIVDPEGAAGQTLRPGSRLALTSRAPIATAAREGKPAWAQRRAEFVARFPDGAVLAPYASGALAVPVFARDRLVGAMGFPFVDADAITGEVRTVARAAADLGGQALERARLFEREQASVLRLRKLQDVIASLSSAVTVQDVCRTCLEHATAGVDATEGVVVLPDPAGDEGTSAIVPVAAVGLEIAVSGEEIPAAAAAAIAESLQTGRASVSDDGWAAFPVATGALALLLPLGRRQLSGADREWLGTIASQASQAIDRAARYEAERDIAETLQRSVLPERLPTVGGTTLAARYLPGSAGVDVGGDWYDAIQLGEGRIGLVVGDVVGKGVPAAAMMGQLRNAMRAFAFEHDDPREVVSRLGQLVDHVAEAPFATLVYLVVDTRTRRVRYVVAGHPPPLVRGRDGATRFLDEGRSLPIGVDSSVPVEEGLAELDEGDVILLYTDGLVERRGTSLDDGLGRLASVASESDGDADELVDCVIEALIGGNDRADDVAVLALRLAAAAVADLGIVVPASKDGLVDMRARLRSWLDDGNVGDDAAGEVVLATWEACANAIEHAQEPSKATFRLDARLDDADWIRLEVRDSGRWKPGNGTVGRGLGLGLMRSLMRTVDVQAKSVGTTVVMERRVDRVEGV